MPKVSPEADGTSHQSLLGFPGKYAVVESGEKWRAGLPSERNLLEVLMGFEKPARSSVRAR
jgi:hypothetical protein